MGILSELRYPSTWYAKLIAVLLALLFFGLLAAGVTAGFVTLRIVSPSQFRPQIDASHLPGHPEDMSFQVPGGSTRQGFFFPGLKSAPTIVLCHGYLSNRSEVLTLATALQDHQYNVFVFDFSAHGTSKGLSSLGFREEGEVAAALQALAHRPDVDRERFGLWGVDLGAYSALGAAEADPRVHALALDSVYDRPEDMLHILVIRTGLGGIPLVDRVTHFAFRWLNSSFRHEPPLSTGLSKLREVSKLFISAADQPELAASSHRLFEAAPPAKEEVALAHTDYVDMLDEEKRSYENRIVSFFLANLPLAREVRR